MNTRMELFDITPDTWKKDKENWCILTWKSIKQGYRRYHTIHHDDLKTIRDGITQYLKEQGYE